MDKLTAIPSEFLTLVQKANEVEVNVNDFDAIIVNTFHRNFEDYALILKKKPSLVLLHNLNFSLFFKSINWKCLRVEKGRFAYYLKLYFSERVSRTRKVISKADYFGVLSQSLWNEIQSQNPAFASKTKVIPLNYCKNFNFVKEEAIQIVMPGNVSNKRKDIKMLFEILPKLHPKSKLHFTFLGKPESDKIVRQIEVFKQNCSENITINYYSQFIPWQEYSEVISKAHLLLCPIKKDTSFYWVNEIYGKTKVSGAEADCIYNGKIGLFPASYPKMNWHNLYYETGNDLTQILNNLTLENLDKEYQKLQPYLQNYTFENVKKQLENQLLQLANTK